ncbi:hypothetical protein PM082_020875 [Marasmius tenuissimus]|nr:hypothetical protein PM082_020875 [Marasmius tenuissimus]
MIDSPISFFEGNDIHSTIVEGIDGVETQRIGRAIEPIAQVDCAGESGEMSRRSEFVDCDLPSHRFEPYQFLCRPSPVNIRFCLAH